MSTNRILEIEDRITELEKELAVLKDQLKEEQLKLENFVEHTSHNLDLLESKCLKKQASWLSLMLCKMAKEIQASVVDDYRFRHALKVKVLKKLNLSDLDEANNFLDRLNVTTWKSETDRQVVLSLARDMLWIIFCWNDHNFDRKISEYALKFTKNYLSKNKAKPVELLAKRLQLAAFSDN